MDNADKVAHVKGSGQTRDHHCHWPGCTQQVPPARWGCPSHWFMLPPFHRKAIWDAYKIGQENNMDLVSRKYADAVGRAQMWILDNYGPRGDGMQAVVGLDNVTRWEKIDRSKKS